MRGNLQGLLAQAQKMQKNVERIQAELGNLEVVGESGAGLVKITMTCKHEARKVETRRQGDARRPRGSGLERRCAQGRGNDPGQDAPGDGRHAAAPGNEAFLRLLKPMTRGDSVGTEHRAFSHLLFFLTDSDDCHE